MCVSVSVCVQPYVLFDFFSAQLSQKVECVRIEVLCKLLQRYSLKSKLRPLAVCIYFFLSDMYVCVCAHWCPNHSGCTEGLRQSQHALSPYRGPYTRREDGFLLFFSPPLAPCSLSTAPVFVYVQCTSIFLSIYLLFILIPSI